MSKRAWSSGVRRGGAPIGDVVEGRFGCGLEDRLLFFENSLRIGKFKCEEWKWSRTNEMFKHKFTHSGILSLPVRYLGLLPIFN